MARQPESLDYESDAAKYRRKRVDVPHQIPVKIELLVELLPNTRIKVVHGLASRFGLEACVTEVFMSKRRTVHVDKNLAHHPDVGRYNAALAEELGHIVLDAETMGSIEGIDDFMALQAEPWWHAREGAVRRWGRALRMPPKELREALERSYAKVVEDFGFLEVETLFSKVVTELSHTFAATGEDVCYRLHEAPGRLRHLLARSAYDQRFELYTGAETTEEDASPSDPLL